MSKAVQKNVTKMQSIYLPIKSDAKDSILSESIYFYSNKNKATQIRNQLNDITRVQSNRNSFEIPSFLVVLLQIVEK